MTDGFIGLIKKIETEIKKCKKEYKEEKKDEKENEKEDIGNEGGGKERDVFTSLMKL